MDAGEIDAVIWCSTRPAILPAYSAAATPALRRWARTRARHWAATTGLGPYREWMSDRIMEMADPGMEAAYYHSALG